MELVIKEGSEAGRTFVAPIGKQVISVGRNRDNDLVLADNLASRHHAKITFQNSQATLEDNDSANGLHLNGQRVTGPVRLKNGDKLKIGHTILEVQGLISDDEAAEEDSIQRLNQLENPKTDLAIDQASLRTDFAQPPAASPLTHLSIPLATAPEPNLPNEVSRQPNVSTNSRDPHSYLLPADLNFNPAAYEATQFANYKPLNPTNQNQVQTNQNHTPTTQQNSAVQTEPSLVPLNYPVQAGGQPNPQPGAAFIQGQPGYNPMPQNYPSPQNYASPAPGYQTPNGYYPLTQPQPQLPRPNRTGLWLVLTGVAALVIVVGFLLFAVLNRPKIDPNPQGQVGTVTAPVSPTTAPVATAIAAPTATPQPTSTPPPTSTPVATATPSPSPRPTTTPTPNPATQAKTLNDQGNSQFDNGNYTQALEKYQAAIALDPKNGLYHDSAGSTLISLGRGQDAIKEFQTATDLDPSAPAYAGHLGYGLYYDYQYDAAEKQLKATIQKFPDYAYGHYYLGLVYIETDKNDLAVAEITKATQLNGTVASFFSYLGTSYYKLHQYDKATDAFNKALKIDSKYAASYNGLGNVSFDQANYQQAISYYKQAVIYNPNSAVYYTNLGNAYLKVNDYPNAKDAAKKALAIDPNNSEAQDILATTGN